MTVMRYTARKILTLLVTMLVVSLLTFAAFDMISGDPAATLLGTQATPEKVEALRTEMGLNRPMLVRYGEWLAGFFTGNLGVSFQYRQPVQALLGPKMLVTLCLSLVSFVLIVVVGGMLLGLIAAVLCNKAFPGIRVFSTSYALPMAIASSSAAMIFQIMLHPAVGIVNKLTGLDINWLNDPNTALICVAILTAWLNSGINFLYFSAGLGNIDETIYERASVDGASSVQQFFSLTLPGLSPIMFYTLVVNIIQAFQSFGQIKILTEGGPNESTNVIVYSIYRDAFFNYRFGSAAAQSVILFIIIMIITLIMFRIEKKGVNY